MDVLVNNSAEAIEFISDFGLELSNLIQLGGHQAKRHAPHPYPHPFLFWVSSVISATNKERDRAPSFAQESQWRR